VAIISELSLEKALGIPIPVLTSLTGQLITLAAVWFGAKLVWRKEERARKIQFKERQLKEFYGPLWALRQEIKELSDYRQEIGSVHSEVFAGARRRSRPLKSGEMPDKESPEFYDQEQEEYCVKQLKEVLLPAYRKMQEVFREGMWLADPETLEFWPKLVRFNELWKRGEESKMHFMVGMKVQVKERKNLTPFYMHLESKIEQLRFEILNGRSPKNRLLWSKKILGQELKPPLMTMNLQREDTDLDDFFDDPEA
jgi:hypothetical protein